ncbi:MAG: dihydropteroate synthase [bacterium]
MAASARVLSPSTPAEAARELERVGDLGSWPGPLGGPPRSGRPAGAPHAPTALRVEAAAARTLWEVEPPDGLQRRGDGEGPSILTGPADRLHAWLERAAARTSDHGEREVLEEVRRVLARGMGLEAPLRWLAGGHPLSLDGGTLIMAVVNTTPDSFYEGSRSADGDALKRTLDEAVEGGAHLVDIGGESTRPGAGRADPEVERERVLPAVEMAVRRTGLPVSIDTVRTETARQALDAGASVINDISGGTEEPDILVLAGQRGAGLVLMHRLGPSAVMQEDPDYDDLMGEVYSFLGRQAAAAAAAGVDAGHIALDPGLGFGKRRQHNFELYRRMTELHGLGYPLLAGPSRKRHTSGPEDLPASERLEGTLAACAVLAWQGVQVLRVHDAEAASRALATVDEIRGALIEDRVS